MTENLIKTFGENVAAFARVHLEKGLKTQYGFSMFG